MAMAKFNDDVTWINDVAVPTGLNGLWQARSEAAKRAAEAREAFEAAFVEHMHDNGLPRSRSLVFNYRFGKLSVAEVAAEAPKAKSTAKGQTDLASFYAAQLGNGRRI